MVFAAEASNPITAVIVAAVLFGISRPIIIRVAGAEAKPWLVSILTASLILHLLCAPAQIFVVDHFYHGVADWVRYDSEGARLAPGFRHFNFSLAPGVSPPELSSPSWAPTNWRRSWCSPGSPSSEASCSSGRSP
jgi:hypothetical protein